MNLGKRVEKLEARQEQGGVVWLAIEEGETEEEALQRLTAERGSLDGLTVVGWIDTGVPLGKSGDAEHSDEI